MKPAKVHLPPPVSNELPDRDECFYFTDVIFLVEGTLFKVPRYPFVRSSEVFRDMFQLPIPNDAAPDGSSDQNPLFLDGIKKTDFRQLLKVMFPIDIYPPHVEPMTRNEWSSVLTLAMMWQMDNVRDQAIQQMLTLPASIEDWACMLKISTSESLLPIRERAINELRNIPVVERILLARECNILSWLLEGYKELVTRDKMISEKDETRLGVGVTLKLLRMREMHYRGNSWVFNVNHAIKKEFGKELALPDYSYTFVSDRPNKMGSTVAKIPPTVVVQDVRLWRLAICDKCIRLQVWNGIQPHKTMMSLRADVAGECMPVATLVECGKFW